MKKIILSCGIVLLTVGLFNSCSKEKEQTEPSDPNILKSALSQSAFSLWTTTGTIPYDISGSNGICVPITASSGEVDAAQQNGGQNATGMQFNGCFKGGTTAESYSEEAVFLCDNISQWDGNEMGFVKTLTDNTLKAYLQGGGNYYTQVISTGDNGYHTFKCQARSNPSNMVDFYEDGSYLFTMTNPTGTYWNNWFYFVATNHWGGGGNPSGFQIEIYNMETF